MEDTARIYKYKDAEFKLRKDTLGLKKRIYYLTRNMNKLTQEYMGFSMFDLAERITGEDILMASNLIVSEKDEKGNYKYLPRVIELLGEQVNKPDCIFDYEADGKLAEALGKELLVSFFIESGSEIWTSIV